MMNIIGRTHDDLMSDPDYHQPKNKHIRKDEYGEKRFMSYFDKPIKPNDEIFRVLVKKSPSVTIFSLDEIGEATNEYFVHAEDINEFIFDEKEYDLIYLAEPLKGKDVL